jgi:hypothetical protein
VPHRMKSALLSRSPSAFPPTASHVFQRSKDINGDVIAPPSLSPPQSPIRKTILMSTNEKISKAQHKQRVLEEILSVHALERKIEHIQAQLGVMHLVPWDMSDHLVLIDVGGAEEIRMAHSASVASVSSVSSVSSFAQQQVGHKSGQSTGQSTGNQKTATPTYRAHLLQKRMLLVGQSVLFGQPRVGNQIARAFQLNVVECVASGLYGVMRWPNRWVLARAMVSGGSGTGTGTGSGTGALGDGLGSSSGTSFDVVRHLQTAMERLRTRSLDKNWVRIRDRVIDQVGQASAWWSVECRTHPPSCASELLHVFGVNLGTTDASMWPITKLLAFTGQYKKCVAYVLLKKTLAKPLLRFLLTEATNAKNEKAIERCRRALSEL